MLIEKLVINAVRPDYYTRSQNVTRYCEAIDIPNRFMAYSMVPVRLFLFSIFEEFETRKVALDKMQMSLIVICYLLLFGLGNSECWYSLA